MRLPKSVSISQPHVMLVWQLQSERILGQSEYRFDPVRRWRLDHAYPEKKIAIEVEGGHWINGRHTRGSGFEKDCEKYNALALAGWRLFRFTPKMVKDGTALKTIKQALRR